MLDVSRDQARELKQASIEETKSCTNYSWNYDCSLLAIVIDARQLYIWTIEGNVFTHVRPANRYAIERESRKQRPKEITAVRWSAVANKLVLCYATGQLLLCGFSNSTVTEKFVDNSDGLLRRTALVETSDNLDLFACLSVINEILVMKFDGQAILYIQVDCTISQIKFAQSKRIQEIDLDGNSNSCAKLWLSCRTKNQIIFKAIQTGRMIRSHESTKQFDFAYDCPSIHTFVDFHWLDESRLITCYSDGKIDLIEFQQITFGKEEGKVRLVCGKVRDVSIGRETAEHDKSFEFKVYAYLDINSDVRKTRNVCTASLLAMTDYHIRYYKLHKSDDQVSIECVDEMDLSGNLRCIDQTLINAKWSFDSQMLAVQLKSGHILVYRASLTNYMIAIKGPKVAYMSDIEEVTVLNYGPTANMNYHTSPEPKPKSTEHSLENDRTSPTSNANAKVIGVNFKPSLIAIGNDYLAVALNNRLRFYNIAGSEDTFFEEEYPTIIDGVSLCSSYVAVHLKDGRLKLQAINLIKSGISTSPTDDMSFIGRSDERYFPDPINPENIVTFTLTESLLVYCSLQCRLTLFCLQQWIPLQVFVHKALIDEPIKKLVANNRGNKILCIFDISRSRTTNAYLYDIYYNTISPIVDNKHELDKLLSNQYKTQPETKAMSEESLTALYTSTWKCRNDINTEQRLNQIVDAMWDTDGRSLLLIEKNIVHIVTLLEHTNINEGPCTFYVDKMKKPFSSNTLYVSQGIVSFQTCLGRVINTILAPYDDELQLTQLEQQFERIRESLNSETIDSKQVSNVIAEMKLQYLKNLLPIYSLSRCKEICNYLMTEEQFNLDASDERSNDIWKLLASWALLTMNLDFALSIYRRHGMASQALNLSKLMRSASSRNKNDVCNEIKLSLQDNKQ